MQLLVRYFLPLLRGLFATALVLWAVATATFLLMKAIPGGPLSSERKLPPQIERAIKARYRLDDSLWTQYLKFLGDAAKGEFGPSYSMQGRTVGEVIAQRLPVSAVLGAVSMAAALLIAFPLGIGAAARPGGWVDKASAFVGAAGISVPSFILGPILLYIFSFRLGWLPSSGFTGVRMLILPTIALAALPTAYLTRLIRSELREVLGSEFLMTARAKGLSRMRVIVVHALRHTLGPVLAYLGPQTAAVMTGSFVIEKIFDIPGIGRQFVNSIFNRDYPMIMGVTLVYTAMLVIFNLLADEGARMLDPRMRR